jgi:hypothetical protein
MRRKNNHNDEERRQWVMNDEGLYDLCRQSRKPVRDWIRENRALIDECIDQVCDGGKPAHYLKYSDPNWREKEAKDRRGRGGQSLMP